MDKSPNFVLCVRGKEYILMCEVEYLDEAILSCQKP